MGFLVPCEELKRRALSKIICSSAVPVKRLIPVIYLTGHRAKMKAHSNVFILWTFISMFRFYKYFLKTGEKSLLVMNPMGKKLIKSIWRKCLWTILQTILETRTLSNIIDCNVHSYLKINVHFTLWVIWVVSFSVRRLSLKHAMDINLGELQKNNIIIDEKTLSHHIIVVLNFTKRPLNRYENARESCPSNHDFSGDKCAQFCSCYSLPNTSIFTKDLLFREGYEGFSTIICWGF